MGKYKERYIEMLNSDIPISKIDFSIYDNEHISNELNERITLKQYIIESKNYIYEIVPIGSKVHLWDWGECRREVGGRLLSSTLNGNLIISQLIETKYKVDNLKLKEYSLKVKIRIK